MRKVIIAIVIILVGVSLYLMFSGSSTKNKARTPTISVDGNFHPDPSNATFTFDDGPITLSAGRHEAVIAPGSAFTEEITLLDEFAYGDINQDGKNDTVLLLAQYGGGSGTFIYLAAYVSGPVNYKGSEATFIGDRVAIQSISINGENVLVKYLDRGADESFAAEPTIATSKQFIYRASEFQER